MALVRHVEVGTAALKLVLLGAGQMVAASSGPPIRPSLGEDRSLLMVTTVDRTVLRTDYHDGTSGVRHVTLTGEADLATVGQLEDDLALLLAPRWVTRLAVDLTALRHLDCAALAALLAVRDHATARGQQVVITAAAGAPERVLALGDIGRLFDYPPLT